MGFPGGSDGKESACNVGDLGLIPESGRSPGEGNGYPTLVFLPGEFHEQRSFAGPSPWGHKELDTEQLSTHTSSWGAPLAGGNELPGPLCSFLGNVAQAGLLGSISCVPDPTQDNAWQAGR